MKSGAPLFLIGFSGVGKSMIGAELAKLLSYEFVDTDIAIEERYHASITQMFAECGIEKFRKREKALLLSLVQMRKAVISTGGGLPCRQDNLDMMLDHGLVIHIRCSEEVMIDNLEVCKATRPLVAHLDKEGIAQYVRNEWPKRYKYYGQADLEIDASSVVNAEEVLRVARHIADLLSPHI